MVKKLGLNDRMEYITFSLHATKEFIRLTPAGTPVFYLDGKLPPKELKEMGCRTGLSSERLPKTSRMDKRMPRSRHESKRLDSQ